MANQNQKQAERGKDGRSTGEKKIAKSEEREQRGLTRRGAAWPALFGRHLRGGSPFAMMRRFVDDLDQMFADFGLSRDFAPTLSAELGRAAWSPEIDVFERDKNLVVRADLPGLTKDDIDIEIDDNQLVLRGERKYEHEETEAGLYRSERTYGSFYRTIPLPEGVEASEVTAHMENGVLEVVVKLPEAREAAARKIEIKEGKGEEPGVH